MTWWERIMMTFFPRHHPPEDQSTRLKHAVAGMLSAQRGTAEESQGVKAAARRDLTEIRAESGRIRARTNAQREKARPGQTSEARSLVDDMLRGMERPSSRDAGS
ncbi:hypothetical protein ASF34_01040 [Methylobacterium sp. Leaf106]|nr:hypothetical protein ASF34_01040 [Methylobacterium sp. Leaf106]